MIYIRYILVICYIAMGKWWIHYFYGDFQQLCERLPEDNPYLSWIPMDFPLKMVITPWQIVIFPLNMVNFPLKLVFFPVKKVIFL